MCVDVLEGLHRYAQTKQAEMTTACCVTAGCEGVWGHGSHIYVRGHI